MVVDIHGFSTALAKRAFWSGTKFLDLSLDILGTGTADAVPLHNPRVTSHVLHQDVPLTGEPARPLQRCLSAGNSLINLVRRRLLN